MLLPYRLITSVSGPLLHLLLQYRTFKGKEDQARISERKGQAAKPRPNGSLVWIHAASVGEAQSALILIQELSVTNPTLNFLVTSGTKTSAELMAKRLPDNAIHQYYTLDHPKWVESFLKHWKPDLVLWMESELWPNMLQEIKSNKIPAILVNARMSDKSFKTWKRFSGSAKKLLGTFDRVLAQTQKDAAHYKELGANNIHVTDNIKYSAAPLPYDAQELEQIKSTIGNRPLWLYASTHQGEESLAARIHRDLVETLPNLLTIIVPRHPERRDEIRNELNTMGLTTVFRGQDKALPTPETEIYVADTLGELGLFYSLSPIAMIGRSFSHDGGGGHNPIEAAQLGCAVLTGSNIQYQTELFKALFNGEAAKQVHTEKELYNQLKLFLKNKNGLENAINNAEKFAKKKSNIIKNVIHEIMPHLPTQNKEAA